VLAGVSDDATNLAEQITDNQLLTEFGLLTENGLSRRDALGELASRHRLRSREVFAAIDRARRS
jgi:hypothetical protein